MVADVAERKRALRAALRAKRAALTVDERDTASLTLHLIELTKLLGANTVSCFLSTSSEPDTGPYLAWARERRIAILLPLAGEEGRLEWALDDGLPARPGPLGVPEPTGKTLEPGALDAADLMLVPAAAVDRDGLRLGWGRGCFDKTLAGMGKWPPVYAVVFPSEILDGVPREPHDQPVDGAVTAAGIIRFPLTGRTPTE